MYATTGLLVFFILHNSLSTFWIIHSTGSMVQRIQTSLMSATGSMYNENVMNRKINSFYI